MPNVWNKQAYVQGFDYKTVTFKEYVNNFEHMEIVETIYEGVVGTSYYKKLLKKTITLMVTEGK